LSLQIFVALLDGFKDHLKSEVEVFITTIFLRILESENSTYDHKLRVLEVFHRICFDSSALVEIFINYDCDLDAIDLFRRIVDSFAKIAKVSLLSVLSGRCCVRPFDVGHLRPPFLFVPFPPRTQAFRHPRVADPSISSRRQARNVRLQMSSNTSG